LGFDDCYVPLEFSGLLNSRQVDALGDLDLELKRISGQMNVALWDGAAGALERPEWQRIRELATIALSALGS
jgi:hypothetical protein